MALFQYGFTDRRQFGGFLLGRKLKGCAVEVGTHRGQFAADLLASWVGILYCIDPWQAYDPTDAASTGDRMQDYATAKANLEPYGHRAELMMERSPHAAQLFHEVSLDFVYVDGCHQPEAVEQDLEAWWPKVKSGGVLAGHDIICPGEPEGGWGRFIQPVVQTFAERHHCPTIYLVIELTGSPWSYYLEKP